MRSEYKLDARDLKELEYFRKTVLAVNEKLQPKCVQDQMMAVSFALHLAERDEWGRK